MKNSLARIMKSATPTTTSDAKSLRLQLEAIFAVPISRKDTKKDVSIITRGLR